VHPIRHKTAWDFVVDNLTRTLHNSGMADIIRVEPIALLPTNAGCAVFLGDGTKVIVFFIDPAIGISINTILSGQTPSRPLTHDLFAQTLLAFGARMSRAIIVSRDNDIYHARMILEAENEVMERKIVELDARPSDCIALAVRCEAPIYVAQALWDSLPDVSDELAEMRKQADEAGE
jgi:bifunctional DNase/RNase